MAHSEAAVPLTMHDLSNHKRAPPGGVQPGVQPAAEETKGESSQIMYGEFFLFLVCFILTAGLLGIIMYGLICISDLENDYVNPHDASVTLNNWALPEFGVQAAITLILGFGGKWFCFLVQLPMLIYNVRTYMRKDHLVHATDVFQNVKTEQKLRFGKLIYTILFFVLVIYRTIAALIDAQHPPHVWERLAAAQSLT